MRSWGTRLRSAALLATVPTSLATVRTGIGAVMLLAPQLLSQVLGVDAASRARTSWLVQMVGAREVAMGAGLLAADRSGTARAWALAGAASDLADGLVVGAVSVDDPMAVRAARRLVDRRVAVDPDRLADPASDLRRLLRG